MPHSVDALLDAFYLLIVAITFVLLFRMWLNKLARAEVYNAPKIPMASCDKHGLIPEDAMLKTTAVALGRPDLEIKHCPICFNERDKAAKGMLL